MYKHGNIDKINKVPKDLLENYVKKKTKAKNYGMIKML